jgi:type I site-specific restriction-modification system R (restriction) subunit
MVNSLALLTFFYFYKNTNFVGFIMQKLNLPEYSFRIKNEDSKTFIFDSFRKKFVRLTPEEWVRQNFVQFLISEKKYSVSLIAIEAGVKVNKNPQRADLVVYNRLGIPLLVAEFKAPEVKISQQAFDQIVRYNMQLKVPYLIVSNGLQHFCCKIDYDNNSYVFLNEIPEFTVIV